MYLFKKNVINVQNSHTRQVDGENIMQLHFRCNVLNEKSILNNFSLHILKTVLATHCRVNDLQVELHYKDDEKHYFGLRGISE